MHSACLCVIYSMFLLAGGRDNQTAAEYFQQVMKTSGTIILWPSRLTIGAKSKKGL